MEHIACQRLISMLPEQLREAYEPLITEADTAVKPIVQAADKLSAYIKCIEEQKAGNADFDSAAKQTLASIRAMELPELDWFVENCLSGFSLDLDQL